MKRDWVIAHRWPLICAGIIAVLAWPTAEVPAAETDSSLSRGGQGDLEVYRLPNGWSISPLGRAIETGDLVMNIAPTPEGRHMIALNSGWSEHALTLFDVESAAVIQRVPLESAWLGLTWSPDGRTLYVSGGNDRRGGEAPEAPAIEAEPPSRTDRGNGE